MTRPEVGAGATRDATIAAYARHVNPTFVRLLGLLGFGRVFVRAEGIWLWDDEGRRTLDALAGFGSVNVGHGHPRLRRRLADTLAALPMHLDHVGPAPHTALLARALVSTLRPPLEVVLLSSSGAEAVEAGLKLACAATGRARFLACDGGFHGTNLGTLALMGAPRLRGPFERLLPRSTLVPFGDLGALERALARRDVAAFCVEPVQAEGGVRLPPPGYLAAAQELCRRHGTVLVLDEVQTGLGRTGTMWAHEAEGLVPDVLVSAKALSGGMVPVAATVTSRELHERAYGALGRFDLHSSTYAGNALACAAASETLAITAEEGLARRSAELGARLLARLRAGLAEHPLVAEVRGRGLLVGIELAGASAWRRLLPAAADAALGQLVGQWVAVRLLERGVLVQPAAHRWNVVRLEPPLTIGAPEVDGLADAVIAVLADLPGLATVAAETAARLGAQWRRGWTF